MRKIISLLCLSVMLSSLCACSLIDDDMTDCATTRTVNCHIHVYDGIDSLLASQIKGTDGQEIRRVLSAYYTSLLIHDRYDIAMDFYDLASGELCKSANVVLEGNENTLTIDLPQGDLRCIAGTTNPLYAGRTNMPQSQASHDIHLYPADAQVAVVAKTDSTITRITVTADGGASAFNAADSTYSYSNTIDTLAYTSSASTYSRQTYTTSMLPTDASKAWHVTIYATTASGSVTRTILTIQKPLKPGDIRILQVSINGKGEASTSDIGVGASITLDWKPGGQYNPDI